MTDVISLCEYRRRRDERRRLEQTTIYGLLQSIHPRHMCTTLGEIDLGWWNYRTGVDVGRPFPLRGAADLLAIDDLPRMTAQRRGVRTAARKRRERRGW